MNPDEMKDRTKRFALDIIRLVGLLPKGRLGDVISSQLLRSATSVAANYRAACRAKSTADFISKMGIVEEEADESMFWMEILIESGIMKDEIVQPLFKEAGELLAITVSSIKTARLKR